jgi:hypothetical protein
MLPLKYQIFLMLLRRKPMLKKETCLFKTSKSFYKMTAFLMRNELVEADTLDGGRKRYSLTLRGDALALMLSNLSDSEAIKLNKYLKREDSLWLN